MKKVKKPLRNSLLVKTSFISVLFILPLINVGQIANYVKNGGFEDRYDCNLPNELNKAKGWNCIGSDTVKFGSFIHSVTCYSNVPLSGAGYQFAHSGDSYYRLTAYCINPCLYDNSRYYPKNRLKGTLSAGKTYCVKMYVNLQNTSPYAIKDLAIYFGNNSIDTINYANRPLTYITPQITNPTNSFYSDTLNWVPFTSTYTAVGNEKYLVIGDFVADASQTKTLVISSSTEDWAEYMIDDVSCIPLDLPAYAGPDLWCVPGTSVFIGRQPDVGIDEACMWYKLPNTITAIDTVAGLWVSPVITTTYIVKQDICGVIKWDTVVVHQSATGVVALSGVEGRNLKVYPQPAKDELNLSFEGIDANAFNTLKIYNSIGQIIREEEIEFKNNPALIKTNELANGVYVFTLKDKTNFIISKRFVIAR